VTTAAFNASDDHSVLVAMTQGTGFLGLPFSVNLACPA
jgi:hypothetical protein